jgi:hypothetical protein
LEDHDALPAVDQCPNVLHIVLFKGNQFHSVPRFRIMGA